MSSHFIIGAYGWDYAQWAPSFYPEDLPGDWRLTYYSRFFASVIVPADCARELTPARCITMLKDVSESFEFFLEIDPEWLVKGDFLATWLSAIDALKPQLSGFLVPEDPQATTAPRQALLDNLHILAQCAPVYLAADSSLKALVPEIPGKIYLYATPKITQLTACSLMVLDSTVPIDLRQLGKCLLEFYKQNQSANKKIVLITGKPPELALLHQAQSLVAVF